MNNSIVKVEAFKMLKALESVDFLSRAQAAELASVALKEFSARSKEGKVLRSRLYDMVLAEGCPNAVFNAAENLIGRYVDINQMNFNAAYQSYNNV